MAYACAQLRMASFPLPAVTMCGMQVTLDNVAKVLAAIVTLALAANAVDPTGQDAAGQGSEWM